jgi:polygalacturonase
VAIQAAAQAGGGTVFLPAGTYLSGSIHLANNITYFSMPAQSSLEGMKAK